MINRLAFVVLVAGLGFTSACETTAEADAESRPVAEGRSAADWAKDFHTKDRATRDAAVAALTKMGPSAIPAVEPELADADSDVRYSAISTLANYRAEALPASPKLSACLADPDVPVRRQAAFTLYHIGEPAFLEAVPALTRAMDDTDAYVRRFAAMALGRMGHHGYPALDALRAHCHDERDRWVREESQKSVDAIEIAYHSWRMSRGDAHPEMMDR